MQFKGQRKDGSPCFPLAKTPPEWRALELLHRQKAHNAVVGVLLILSLITTKKYTQKGWGERLPPGSKRWGPFPYTQLYIALNFAQANVLNCIGEDQGPLELFFFFLFL